jgi:hypothetical protein
MVTTAVSAFAAHAAPVGVPRVRPPARRLTGLWRFDRQSGAWHEVALPASDDLESLGGLYWAEWQENGRRSSSLVRAGSARRANGTCEEPSSPLISANALISRD